MPQFVLDARTATSHFPGIGRYVRSLAGSMVPLLDPSERLVLLSNAQQPFRIDGATSVPVEASPFSLSQQWLVPRALHSLGFNLYHSPYYLMPYRTGVPTVLTVYDTIPIKYPEYSSLRSRLLFRLTTRMALAAARHIVAITENARRDFISEFGIAPERITPVPLAADPVFCVQPQQAVEAVRQKYDLPDCFVLYVGSNKPHKNLTGLVAAWAELARDAQSVPELLNGAQLVVAGAWDERYPEAQKLAGSRDISSVRWLGPVPDADLPALYTAASVFVFPSFFEGFGLPVIEAMACGAPVICSNATALPEVTGDAALLVDPSDRAALAEALRRMLSDVRLRMELREQGLRRAAQFSWTRTAEATLAIYRNVFGAL